MNRADNTYYAAYGGHAENVYVWGGQANHIEPEGYEPHDDEMRRYRELHASGARTRDALGRASRSTQGTGASPPGESPWTKKVARTAFSRRSRRNSPIVNSSPARACFLMTRLVKTADELDRLREAAQVNEDAITKVFEFVRMRA